MRWTFFESLDFSTAQSLMVAERDNVLRGTSDGVLFALQHPAVISLGRSASHSDILLSEDQWAEHRVEIVRAERGGGVTYHGPGQLVIYPVVSLRALKMSTPVFIETLAGSIVTLLTGLGVNGAHYDPKHPGVWVRGRKIASIGLRIYRGVSTHGISINISDQNQPFSWIVACHMPQMKVTSVQECSANLLSLREVASRWIDIFGRLFRLDVAYADPRRFS